MNKDDIDKTIAAFRHSFLEVLPIIEKFFPDLIAR